VVFTAPAPRVVVGLALPPAKVVFVSLPLFVFVVFPRRVEVAPRVVFKNGACDCEKVGNAEVGIRVSDTVAETEVVEVALDPTTPKALLELD